MEARPSSVEDAPFGLEALRWVPRAAFRGSALLGLFCLSTPLWVGENRPLRNLLCLTGLVLLDFGLAGLRSEWLPALLSWLRRWGWRVLLGLAAVGLAAEGGSLLLGWREKRAVQARATWQGSASILETAGLARKQDLVVLPLQGPVPDPSKLPADVAVYDGLECLPASVLDEDGTRSLVLSLDIGARAERRLEISFGTTCPAVDLDPEQSWNLQPAEQKGLASFRWKAQDATEAGAVLPYLGRSSLMLEVVPMPELAKAFLWIELPVPGPKQVSASTQLLYAIRTEGRSTLRCSVHVRTDQGYSWEKPATDQDGRPTDPAFDLGEQALGRWCLRRVPLGRLAGATLHSAGLLVYYPYGMPEPPQPVAVHFDAVRLVDGPPLQGVIAEIQQRGP